MPNSELNPDSAVTSELLSSLANGSSVFDQLFARHRSFLKSAIEFRMDQALRARIDASDIVQEAEILAFERIQDYLQRRPMPFRIWLRKTAQEQLIMAHRRHVGASRRSVRREVSVPNRSSAQLAKLVASDKTPSRMFNDEEMGAKVRRALAELDEKDREVLLMRHYENLSYNEIAYILEIESATARQRSGRALIRLSQLLTNDGITGSQL